MLCRNCSIELNETNQSASFFKRKFSICRKCDNIAHKNRNVKRRNNIIDRLGGECECCKITNHDLISIDHINGGGIKDRDSFSTWKAYMKHLENLPIEDLKKDYRCLCYNCNYTRGFWGCCPHSFNSLSAEQLQLSIDKMPTCNKGIKQTHLSNDERQNRHLNIRRIQRLKIKLEMIAAYGGRCQCCNETSPLFLVLDHINNNGYLDKYCGVDFYESLKKLGYPGNGTQLQLLCHNCNAQKEYIQNRVKRVENMQTTSNKYIKQDYSISKDEIKSLKEAARFLLAQITAAKLLIV